jgi:hypothetical protein
MAVLQRIGAATSIPNMLAVQRGGLCAEELAMAILFDHGAEPGL